MRPGLQVGQFVLERPLGDGGMAEVWLARNVHLGSYAAVKCLKDHFASRQDVVERFVNEGRRQGALDHPNIVKVFGFDYAEGRSFLIMQFIDGEALDLMLHRTGPMPIAQVLPVATGILNALEFAHSHQIVHRDVKPSNILIDRQGAAYLGDFGIVLAVNEKRLTQTGTVMGTPHYMSPEQIARPKDVDHRADIYSFGCVLFEMLTGAAPFDHITSNTGDTDFAVKMAHIQAPVPSPRQRNPSIPPAVEQVVLRCLAKDPNQRYATCGQLRDALAQAAAVQQPPIKKEKPIWPWVAASAGACVLGAAGLGAYLWPKDPRVVYFVASPATIYAGDEAVLKWSVSNVKNVEIDSSGTHPDIGTITVRPTMSHSYRLVAKNAWKRTEYVTTVNVVARPPRILAPEIRRFEILPSRVKPNEPARIYWEVANASRVEVGGKSLAATGSAEVSARTTSTYKIRAWSSNGILREAVRELQVEQPAVVRPPEVLLYEYAPSVIREGESSTLRWRVRGATSIKIGQQMVESEGSVSVTATASRTSTMLADGPGGRTTRVIELRVIPAVRRSGVQITNFRTSGLQTVNGGPIAYLYYAAPGATRITIQPEVGTLTSTSGTVSVFPTQTTQYTMTAYGADGSTDTRTVVVQAAGRPLAPPVTRGMSWQVMHHHAGPKSTYCHGTLYTQDGRLIFDSRTSNDGFDVPFSEVIEVQANTLSLGNYRAFHVKTATRNMNFIPRGSIDTVVQQVNRAIGR